MVLAANYSAAVVTVRLNGFLGGMKHIEICESRNKGNGVIL